MSDDFLTPDKLRNILTKIINDPDFVDRSQVCEAIENSLCDMIRESLDKYSDWSAEHFLLLAAGLMFQEILGLQEKVSCLDISKPEYEIVLMTEKVKSIEANKIYIKRIGDSLEYKLINPGSGIIAGSIPFRDWTRLTPGVTVNIPDYAFDEKNLPLISRNILNFLEKNGYIHRKNYREIDISFDGYIYA